jgi:nucleotide-binding universal stress UspA family protein
VFDNVVVGVNDYAGGRRALLLARALVVSGGRITLVYVEVVQTKPAPELDARAVGERQQYGLERLRRLRDKSQIDADVARTQAPSARHGLHEFAANGDADLIVIGSSGGNALARSRLGDDVREVLDDPPCAVAVAPYTYSGHPAQMRRIGVGYDGSRSSQRAVAIARKVAAEHFATLSAYQAVAAPVPARARRSIRGDANERLGEARQRLADLGGVEAHAEFTDDPAEGIRQFGASVDLLILGSPASRPPERVVYRSTPQRVADHTLSPLLVVAPDDHLNHVMTVHP